ncbi:hypothetical protein RDABS01_032079 [Bienertia sinuspersici]
MDFESKEDDDRISDFPDHILCHILSFIPTKYAVRTSVLSKRWKNLWASVPILDFDARLHGGFNSVIKMNEYPESEITFQNFVNRVMLLNDILHIQKFRLIYECHYSAAPISTWLHVATSHDILELELDFYLSVPKEFISFPMLKILEIRWVVYLDDKSTQKLLSGCQVLEELVIEETTREKPRVIDISMHTLKSFCFSYRFAIDISVDCPYKFVINAPNLEYFHVKGRISDDFVVKSLGNLVNAHLDLRHTAVLSDNYNLCQQRVFNLFKGITNVKFLLLSNDIVQLLSAAYNLNLPRFFNLTTVGLGIGVDICWKRLVTEFIRCSPDMDALVLNNKQGLYGDIEELHKIPRRHMPENLLFQLKDILIQELYSNFLPEAVENLLQDVNVLKRLSITCQCPIMLESLIGDAFES